MSGKVGDNLFRASGVIASGASEYDDDQIQSNIAMLGFYVAVNGSLVRFNLVDQSIDEYFDTSGVDASASTDESRTASGSNYYYSGASVATVTQDADNVAVDGDYTVYKWTDTAATGSYNISVTSDHTWLVVGGGGGGGDNGGGGGAGGFRAGASLSLTGGNTYTITVGDGGTAPEGDGGDSILSGTGITTVTSTGGGGGGGGAPNNSGSDGGSGGGRYGRTSPAVKGDGNTPAITPITGETTTVQGFDGGLGWSDLTTYTGGGGGGGASEVGADQVTTVAGDGGDGSANSITGASVTYAGGGGGSVNAPHTAGSGGAGGGGNGSQNATGTAGTDGLGGGGGTGSPGMVGGSGIVFLRRLTTAGTSYNDMSLQSTDVSAVSEPDYSELVTLMEDGAGTATLNTDIKGYISRDSGTTFTQGTLASEGSWGTNKKILAFHDLDISAQPSGTSMCYKITTHNQSVSKETRIWATSIGWR